MVHVEDRTREVPSSDRPRLARARFPVDLEVAVAPGSDRVVRADDGERVVATGLVHVRERRVEVVEVRLHHVEAVRGDPALGAGLAGYIAVRRKQHVYEWGH